MQSAQKGSLIVVLHQLAVESCQDWTKLRDTCSLACVLGVRLVEYLPTVGENVIHTVVKRSRRLVLSSKLRYCGHFSEEERAWSALLQRSACMISPHQKRYQYALDRIQQARDLDIHRLAVLCCVWMDLFCNRVTTHYPVISFTLMAAHITSCVSRHFQTAGATM